MDVYTNNTSYLHVLLVKIFVGNIIYKNICWKYFYRILRLAYLGITVTLCKSDSKDLNIILHFDHIIFISASSAVRRNATRWWKVRTYALSKIRGILLTIGKNPLVKNNLVKGYDVKIYSDNSKTKWKVRSDIFSDDLVISHSFWIPYEWSVFRRK